MNILLISDLYPLNIPLYYENKDNYYLHDLATELQNIGHVVDVVKLNSIWKFFYDRQNFYANGVYELDKNIIYNINYFIPYFSTPQEKLNDDIDINNYDIVIAHGLNGIFFCEKLIKDKIVTSEFYIRGYEAKKFIIDESKIQDTAYMRFVWLTKIVLNLKR